MCQFLVPFLWLCYFTLYQKNASTTFIQPFRRRCQKSKFLVCRSLLYPEIKVSNVLQKQLCWVKRFYLGHVFLISIYKRTKVSLQRIEKILICGWNRRVFSIVISCSSEKPLYILSQLLITVLLCTFTGKKIASKYKIWISPCMIASTWQTSKTNVIRQRLSSRL